MLSKIRNTFNGIRIALREDRIMKYWETKKVDKLAEEFKKIEHYNQFKINDFSFLYFLINEKDNKAIDTLLDKVSYKKEILDDENNPMNITPICYAFLEGDKEIVQIL